MGESHQDSALVLIVPIRVINSLNDDWQPGPLPVAFGPSELATRELRSKYFYPAVVSVLYGSRWHKQGAWSFLGLNATAVEVLIDPDAKSIGFAAIHCLPNGRVRDAVSSIRDPHADTDLYLHAMAPDITAAADGGGRYGTPFALSFSLFKAERTGRESRDEVLFRLASGTDRLSFPFSGNAPNPLPIPLSNTWDALPLRDGLAFAVQNEGDPFVVDGYALGLVRSVYLDAVLLALMQRDQLEVLADQLLDGAQAGELAMNLAEARQHLDTVRGRAWFGRLSRHEVPDSILQALRREQGTEILARHLTQEIESRASYHRELQQDRLERLLMLITVVGLPVSVILGVGQIAASGGGFMLSLPWLGAAILVSVVCILMWRRFGDKRRKR